MTALFWLFRYIVAFPALCKRLGGYLRKIDGFVSVRGDAECEHTGQVGAYVNDLSRVLAEREKLSRMS